MVMWPIIGANVPTLGGYGRGATKYHLRGDKFLIVDRDVQSISPLSPVVITALHQMTTGVESASNGKHYSRAPRTRLRG